MAKLMTLRQANTTMSKIEAMGFWSSKTMWYRQAYSVTAVDNKTHERTTFETVDEFEKWQETRKGEG
jgi:hypothetical protein